MQVPDNEDVSVARRKTYDGRTLTYRLSVLQQPERARACGAGARSSADRRPVDPPPVIELRVFEGESQDLKDLTDITLKHNATFILAASLENARPIAPGRMHTPPNIASLQGVNFAGTNYLDRPSPAGYFIFPDLSVRNEGWYRLNFSLLEGTKEPQDADPDRPFPTSPQAQNNGEPRKPLTYEDMATRLDVRSRPFQVFSAKKFPGLSESTDLSRLVADQGCRVRIRRDVRMRKHGERRKDDGDAYEDGRRSADRYATPDGGFQPQTPMDRPRSISRASMEGSQYSGGDHYRRASGEIAYFNHPYSAAQTPLGSAGPSPSIQYHVPVAPMPPTPGAHSYASYAPSANHIASVALPNSFPVPQPPRHPQDSATYGHLAAESRTYSQSSANPAAMPRSITPDNARPSVAPALPAVSSIHSLTNPSRTGATFDTSRGLWNLPKPSTLSKRSYSPVSAYAQTQPLKSGMRPDAGPTGETWSSVSMEADPRPYNSDEDEDWEDTRAMMMKYRRANGSVGRKTVPYTDASGQ